MGNKKRLAPGRVQAKRHRPNPVPRDGGDSSHFSTTGTKSQVRQYDYRIPDGCCDYTGMYSIERQRTIDYRNEYSVAYQ